MHRNIRSHCCNNACRLHITAVAALGVRFIDFIAELIGYQIFTQEFGRFISADNIAVPIPEPDIGSDVAHITPLVYYVEVFVAVFLGIDRQREILVRRKVPIGVVGGIKSAICITLKVVHSPGRVIGARN